METMKAVRIHDYGGPEMLVYEDAPRPQPKSNEVLVRVHATSVNPRDWKVREGLRRSTGHVLPLVMGWDLSGVVTEIGADCKRLKVGDEVYSRPDSQRDGSYAEYIVMREAEVALKPKSIDHVNAAAIPLAGLTAWQALFDAANLAPGQKVLIHAAAGGVGCFAIQFAKWKGAYVIGTGSARNQALIRELGADEAIDYNAAPFETLVKDCDVVFDTMGGETQARSWGVLKKGGILVSVVERPSPEEAAKRGVRGVNSIVHPDAEDLAEIAEIVDAGKLRVVIEEVFSLAEARKAQESNASGHTRGKIVLRVI